MRLILSFASLFLSVMLLQLSTGGVGPLDALSGIALNFTNGEIGILGSAHFFGFFIGCWWAPRLMGNVGHSRAFAAFTATGDIALLAHMLVVDPLAWAVMRVGSGLCVAGCYTVIEAWLQERVTNDTRGRAMGLYRVADISAALMSQMLISVLEPAAYASYNLLALLCCAAILPLTLTREAQPPIPDAPRLRPLLAWAMSPLAVVSVVVSGLTTGAFRMVGPIYGQEVGLDTDGIALFLTIYIAGGAVAQYPMGWLADRFDRRHVLVGLSVGAIAASGVTVALAGAGTGAVLVSAALFGFASFPLYSVATAHAHDFADTAARVELSAALMFWYAVGAIASPYTAALLIDSYGPTAMFVMISVGHAALILFSVTRMNARPTPDVRTAYVYAPRTSFLIGRLMARLREGKDD
jgi:MFS family permease